MDGHEKDKDGQKDEEKCFHNANHLNILRLL